MLARTQVLTFHGIGDPIVPLAEGEGRYFVPSDTYRRTIRSLGEYEARHKVHLTVTFDDGNLSDYAVGLPALVEAGRSAMFAILAGRIDRHGYLSGSQIRDMLSAGMTIATHGYDHVDWRRLDEAGRQRELYDARRKIEDEAGQAVTEAAIPFGAFDRSVLHELKAAGYTRVYTSTSGLSLDGSWFCPRWSVTEDFDPDRDMASRLSLKEVIRSTAFAALRRARYRI
ncbi:polysaccharide deacetylase family protein [uncultured Roseibium sp.]|uniref:polysaccharide deacetylase family protein n=1 Tax=uncultured Roseibium sp. TaxID=1936171 RepID=UPI003217E9C3